jgi:glycosyltransferase involved in cell wall biosynthesis
MAAQDNLNSEPTSPAQDRPESFPLITVVIPWIGREKYIGSTLAALRAQDYPNLEIAVSDNSLSSDARSLLVGIDDAAVRVMDRSDKRLSSADHFTACVRDATGEFVMILSDDDLIEPGYVSGMYDAIRSHPTSSVVLGEQIVIGENDVPQLSPSEQCSHVEHHDGARFFLRRLVNPKRDQIVTYVSLFARRRDLLKLPFRDYPDGSNSDNFMMLCLALTGDVTVCSRKMYYRIYESSSGLRTPFNQLLKSCAKYESDAAELICLHHNKLSFAYRMAFRVLMRVRNCSMMARRLFTLYRRRLSRRELLASSCKLACYFVGLGSAAK